MSFKKRIIAVIGGTGKQGYGLALRWAAAGHKIIVGSRDATRAQEAATEIAERADSSNVTGAENIAAAGAAEIVVLAVPFASQEATLAPLKEAVSGKLVIDVTAPLVPPKVGTVQLPEGGSAVLNAQRVLGDEAQLVAAFQNIAAQHLANLEHDIDCDVLVCGNKKAMRKIVIALAADAGMTGWHAGPLANAVAAEAMTAVLISINRAHGIPGSGIRITGAPTEKDGSNP
jgi:NADPH-dependent F420 reductase